MQGFLLWLMLPGAHADTLVVASDGTGDYSTISDALAGASVGDTIAVRPGTYSPSRGENLPYYFPSNITIEGAGRDLTVVDAEGEASFGIVFSPSVTLRGLTFTNAPGDGSYGSALSMRQGGLIEECAFRGNGNGALGVGGGTVVRNSVFIDNTALEPYATTSIGGSNATLIGVEIFDSPRRDQYSVRLDTPIVVIEGSAFYGGTVRLDDYGGDGSSITNSVFAGLQGGPEDICVNANALDGWFANNTVVGCSGGAAVDAFLARNNVVAHNAGAGFESAYYAAYNLSWDNAGGDWSGTDWSGELYNISADPRFQDFSDDGDWTNDDLRLAEDSPGIDSAAADCPAYDIAGVPRPQDGNGDGIYRCDMGAWEWGQIDEDGDGWYLDGGDCDDSDPDINPGVEDIPYDGIDQDCDGGDLIDVDGDGFDAEHQGGTDCDDTDADIHPGAWDIPGDGIDQDCDGLDSTDTDGDGWPDDQDCAPEDASIHPGATELCDGIDQDCDGEIDEGCDTGAPDTEDTAGPVDGVTGDPDRLCGCGGCRDGGAAGLLLPLPLVARRRRHSG